MDFHPVVLAFPQSFMEYSEWQPNNQFLYLDIFNPATKKWALHICRMAVDYHCNMPLTVLANQYQARGGDYVASQQMNRPLKIVKQNMAKGVRCGPVRPTYAALERVMRLSQEDFLNPARHSPRACAEIYALLTAMIYDAHVSFDRSGVTHIDRFPISHLRFTSAMRPVEVVAVHPYTTDKREFIEREVKRTVPMAV